MAKKAKRIQAWTGDREALMPFADAIKAVKDNAKAKFDESIEIAVNLGVDPRHADQQVRGVVSLPSGTGRDVRVAVFAKDAKAEEAKAAGAEYVGAEDLYEQINGGLMDFDRVIAACCSSSEQIARMRARDALSEADARRRLAAQWPIDEKCRQADFAIDTSGSFAHTDEQVRALARRLSDESSFQL